MSDFKKPTYGRICELAEGQSGFVQRSQLFNEGAGRATLESWLRTSRLLRAWPGVYAVGHMPTEPRAQAFGAMLAVGDDAALAGFSAGAFYGVVRRWPEPFELITPRQCRVSGLLVHRSNTLLLRDVWRHDGLRVTSPARTGLDLAGRVGEKRLHAIVDDLRLRHSLNLAQLTDVIDRNPRHAGAAPLRRLIGAASKRASRSGLERRWPQIAREQGLPPFEMNVMVGGYEVDVLVGGVVIVELDTFGTHVLNFESDRRRDAEILARTGIPTIRVTDQRLVEDPAGIAGQILQVISARRAAMWEAGVEPGLGRGSS